MIDPPSSRMRRLRSRFRPRRRPRFQGQSFNRLIPNIMTLIGLCAGLTSIRFALEERWEAAAIAIVLAVHLTRRSVILTAAS